MQLDLDCRNAILDALETMIGPSPILEFRSGVAPVNTAAADSGVLLAQLILPVDWMAPASGGTKVLAGVWQDSAADASGTTVHFRLKNSAGTVCRMQGTVATTGTPDILVSTASITAGQQFTVSAFTFTAGNP